MTLSENKARTELSELTEPIWAVISFDRVESSNIGYDEATALLKELELNGVAGLCVVTADAAERLSV